MKVTTLPKLLLLGTAMSLPVASLAQPPAWAGKGKGPAGQQKESHEREYRRDDRHRNYRDYRYSDRERDALRRHLSNRDYQSLPPGLQRKWPAAASCHRAGRRNSRLDAPCPMTFTTTGSVCRCTTAYAVLTG